MAFDSRSRSIENLPPPKCKILHPDLTSGTAESIADSSEFGQTLTTASNGANKRAVFFEHPQLARYPVNHPHPVQVVHSDGSDVSKLLRSVSLNHPNPYALHDLPPGPRVEIPRLGR